MSIYEKNYIRWYLQSNKKKLLFLVILLFVSLPMLALLTPEKIVEQNYSVPFVFETFIYVFLLFVLALIVPLYNFNFLMGKRSIDTFFAMPIKRKRFFVLQYALGIISVLILVNGTFLLALLCERATWGLLGEFLTLMLLLSIVALCMYTLYTFLIIKCNNLWDAIVVCIAYTILPLIVFSALNSLVANALSSFLVSTIANVGEVFSYSILNYALSLLTLGMYTTAHFFEIVFNMHMEPLAFYDQFLDFSKLLAISFWMIVSVVLFVRARHAFTIRCGEASEQRTTTWVCYPVLIVLITFSLLMNENISFQSFGSIMNIMFVFVVYLIMVFFAKRKIALTKSISFIFIGLMVVVMSITFIFTATRGFNRIQELPKLDEVESVQLFFYSQNDRIEFKGKSYWNLNSGEVKDIDAITEIYDLQNFIASNMTKSDILYEYRISVNLQYALKNGEYIQREYRFINDDERFKEEVFAVMEHLYNKGYFEEDMRNQAEHE